MRIMQFGICEVCDVVFTSEQNKKDHLNGSKHKKKLARLSQPTGPNFANSPVQSPPPAYHQSNGQNQIPQQPTPFLTPPQMYNYSNAQPPGMIIPPSQTSSQTPQQVFAVPVFQAPQHPQVWNYRPAPQPSIQNTINLCIQQDPSSGNVIQSGPTSQLQRANGTPGRKDDDKQPSRYETSPNETSKGEWYCQYCFINCNSAESMNEHKKGSRHQKNLKEAETAGSSAHPYFCLVCDVPCNSENTLENHCQGAPHLKNMRDKADRQLERSDLCCSACKVKCSGQMVLEEHLRGQFHQSNAAKARPPPVQGNTSPQAPGAPVLENSRICQVCNKRFNSEIPLKAHFEGGKHQRNAKEKAVDPDVASNNLYCGLCKVLFSSSEVRKDHFGGPAHRYNVEEWERSRRQAGPGGPQQFQRRKTNDIDELTASICEIVHASPGGLALFKDELVNTEAMTYRPHDKAVDATIELVVRKLKKREILMEGKIGDFLEMCKQANERANGGLPMWSSLGFLCEEFASN